MGESEGESKKPSEAFHYCRLFRRLAKRARALPGKGDDESSPDHLSRSDLLEELVDTMSEVDVWADGIVEGVCTAMLMLYAGDDADASDVLNQLADEELDRMKGKPPTAPEDGEEGDGGSE